MIKYLRAIPKSSPYQPKLFLLQAFHNSKILIIMLKKHKNAFNVIFKLCDLYKKA
ncbi:hypothetical protein SAMN05421643_10528 [Acinetobacter kyonggiensis]|uniref:Uncharacterized protein n=1 Tax=Acinetobacter kyonggiensis TaxID=595670 RepID=A0A1H3HTN0_9GAMM|nr:hypothetical protein SAMN05421643_10528 [Acinetobacter kyonggiensis]